MNDLKYSPLFCKYNDHYDISKISKVCVFLPNEGLVLTINGEVFYVLNTGFEKLEVFNKKNVIEFAYATTFVNFKLSILILVLTEYEIYGWGPNRYRQVSINNKNDVPEPQKIEIPSSGPFTWDRFTSISCVYGHCMALTSDNCLILWGSNSHGQIGNGKISSIETAYRIKFRKSLFGKTEFKDKKIIENTYKIVSISCSARNSYCLLENGDVYGWGENSTGQMGTIHANNYVNPQLIYGSIKQFVAFRNYALALREDGTLFSNGDNSYGQIGDYNGKPFHYMPYRFELTFQKFATWKNLSMGLTKDGKCYIWGDYGAVEFASIRFRITIDRRKNNQSTQVNLNEEQSENDKQNSVNKPKQKLNEEIDNSESDSAIGSETTQSRLEDFQENTNEQIILDENYFNENKLEENNRNKSISVEPKVSDIQPENTTDKRDEENTDKELDERLKILEIIKSGKIEYHRMDLTLKKPTEIKCKSFSKIIANRCNDMYFTVKSDLSNGYRTDDKNDLIDLSNLYVVIYDYEEIIEQEVETFAKTDDKKEIDLKEKEETEKYNKLEERVVTLEKKKLEKTVQKIHIGDKSKFALFDKSTISKVDDFIISDINQTGTVGAATSNC